MAWDIVLETILWLPISFVFDVEELNRKVVLQVDHCSFIKNNVEVLSFNASVASEEKIFRIDISIESALEVAMLTIELEIPRNHKMPPVNIIDDKDLY